MKLNHIFLFISVFVSVIALGQAKYGLKIGVNISDQYKKINPPGYPAEKLETKIFPGFQLGAFLKQKMSNKLSLATELNFSIIGSKTKYARTDFIVNPDGTIAGETTGYYNDKIQQFEIPILLQYNIDNFYLGLGPSIGINLTSKIDEYQNNSFKTTYYKTADFSASSVIGYSLHKKLDLTFRYNYGISNIDKRDYSMVKSRALTFSVLFSLK